MEALKINKSLWSLPLDFSFDSSEINELIKVMDIELQEVVISPNADMWYFLFMKEEFILVSDVDDGLDIRFFKKENEDLAKKFINKITSRSLSVAGVGNLRGSAPSTRGPEWTYRWCTSCLAKGIAG